MHIHLGLSGCNDVITAPNCVKSLQKYVSVGNIG